MTQQLPPDAAAYMLQAAQQLMQEQDFQPATQVEINEWISQNVAAIAQRASQLQWSLLTKMETEAGQAMTKLLAVKVWGATQKQAIAEQEQQQINRILED